MPAYTSPLSGIVEYQIILPDEIDLPDLDEVFA